MQRILNCLIRVVYLTKMKPPQIKMASLKIIIDEGEMRLIDYIIIVIVKPCKCFSRSYDINLERIIIMIVVHRK